MSFNIENLLSEDKSKASRKRRVETEPASSTRIVEQTRQDTSNGPDFQGLIEILKKSIKASSSSRDHGQQTSTVLQSNTCTNTMTAVRGNTGAPPLPAGSSLLHAQPQRPASEATSSSAFFSTLNLSEILKASGGDFGNSDFLSSDRKSRRPRTAFTSHQLVELEKQFKISKSTCCCVNK